MLSLSVLPKKKKLTDRMDGCGVCGFVECTIAHTHARSSTHKTQLLFYCTTLLEFTLTKRWPALTAALFSVFKIYSTSVLASSHSHLNFIYLPTPEPTSTIQ